MTRHATVRRHSFRQRAKGRTRRLLLRQRAGELELQDWADQLLVELHDYPLPQLMDDDEWKTWGNDVVALGSPATTNCPRTDGYDKWDDWAEAFTLALGD
jgi:hypothetical protein